VGERDGDGPVEPEGSEPPELPAPTTPPELARIPVAEQVTVIHSVLAGICPLSPIPFIDDLVIGFIRRRMIRKLFARQGLELSRPQLKALVSRRRGCVRGCLFAVVLYPIKRIFRKILYIFAIKSCVDTCSTLLHEGLLVRYALAGDRIPAAELAEGGETSLLRVNAAIEVACRETDTSPVTQLLRRLFRGGRVLLKEAARTVMILFRKLGGRRNPEALDRIEERVLSDERVLRVIAEVYEAVWTREGYVADVEARFDEAWAAQDVQELVDKARPGCLSPARYLGSRPATTAEG